jgi:malonyl-CoA O-methyltransferase
MSNPTSNTIDKSRVRAAFAAAARHYDSAAILQREVADRLIERLDPIRLQPRRILELGSGTGYLSRHLAQRYPAADRLAIDFALPMLQQGRARQGWRDRLRRRQYYICADMEALPFAAASFDLIISNLTLQWSRDLQPLLADLRRLLRREGLLLFSTLGPDTLKELRAAWAAVDNRAHVNPFLDMHEIGDALLANRLAAPVIERDDLILTYGNVTTLMRDLKTLGAHNTLSDRPRGLTGRHRLAQMIATYERFRCEDRLPATWEVIYAHAWQGTAAEPAATPQQVAITWSKSR